MGKIEESADRETGSGVPMMSGEPVNRTPGATCRILQAVD